MYVRKKSINFLFQPVYLSSTPCVVRMTRNMLYSLYFIPESQQIQYKERMYLLSSHNYEFQNVGLVTNYRNFSSIDYYLYTFK